MRAAVVCRAGMLVLLLLIGSNVGVAAELRILTTEVPPLAFTRDGQVTGFCVEVVKAIQQRRKRGDGWGGHVVSPEFAAKRGLACGLKYD